MAVSHHILAVDIGTTALKVGVYELRDGELVEKTTLTRSYEIHTYNNGLFSDIDPQKWLEAFGKICSLFGNFMPEIDFIALSGTTPGLTAMDEEGNALNPAILMLDQRSREEAALIVRTIGLESLLRETGNMPVAGGCSLASILWLKNNRPDVFSKTACFGHSNTFFAKWLTGEFAIDPSSASLSALYNTVENKLEWNAGIAKSFGIAMAQLPKLIPSCESVGRVKSDVAHNLGLKKEPPVIIGGNDAVLAAWSAGINHPGDVMNVNGTCEITLINLPSCLASASYNVRAHVLPGQWLTLHVMNAGGKAYQWFHSLYCSEMSKDDFFSSFLPGAIDNWLDKKSSVTYVPYLMGSRYSHKPLKAEFRGLTLNTTLEEMAAALTRALCRYQRKHLREINRQVELSDTIHVSGGAASKAIIRAKKKWMWPAHYLYVRQSSLVGAAMLAKRFLLNNIIP